ncbi:MAG TPA: sulfite exporter TauE/SafE family protein [Longimicrobiales bacterium]|nr:sulfite exporter TauE/SafE family protein [Longimicrobiales bacterium]
MDLTLWQWVLAGLGSVMFGIAKTGVAGLGILPVAIFAAIMPARESVGVVLVVLIIADIVAVTVYRRDADWSQLLRLFPPTVVGIVVGTFALGRFDDDAVRTLIGAILIVLVIVRVVRDRGPLAREVERPRWWFVGLTGVGAGFTTMVANAAGPIMILYLLAMRLPKVTFVGTTAWFFLTVNLFKVPFSYSLGLISAASLAQSLALWPFAIGGALFGRWLIRYIDQRLFENLALALTFVASLGLLFA